MPVNKKMMRRMKDKYGDKAGEKVYAAVEKKQKGNLMVFGKRGQKTTNKSKKG
jgi:hypothetical protein